MKTAHRMIWVGRYLNLVPPPLAETHATRPSNLALKQPIALVTYHVLDLLLWCCVMKKNLIIMCFQM